MAMVKQMRKAQSFKQCRLCRFVFLDSANIFVVLFLGKCLDVVSTQNPGIDRFQTQATQINLKFQAIRIQQEILHSHDDKTFIISPRLLTAIYNDNLLKRVWDIT